MEARVAWVFLFVFIDVLGFSLILPLLPFYAKEFHTSSSVIGLMLTFNAVTQMISAPVIGRFSDQYGRKPLLLLCIFGTIVGFIMLATSTSVTILFLSRIIDGLLGGNISLAHTYISDVTPANDERSKGFGIIGAAFGIGFIVGPAIGGTLSVYGYSVPAYVAAGIAAINFFGVYFFLPESLPVEKRRKTFYSNTESTSVYQNYFSLAKVWEHKKLASWLILRFFYLFVFTLFETSFGFFNLKRLDFDARRSSYLLVYLGIFYSAIQGGGIKALTKRYNEEIIVYYSFVLFGLSLALWSWINSLTAALLILVPLSLACGTLNTLINSQVSKQIQHTHMGELLGVSAAVGSLTRILAPITGGILLDTFGEWSPGMLGAAMMIYMGFYMVSNKLDQPSKDE